MALESGMIKNFAYIAAFVSIDLSIFDKEFSKNNQPALTLLWNMVLMMVF